MEQKRAIPSVDNMERIRALYKTSVVDVVKEQQSNTYGVFSTFTVDDVSVAVYSVFGIEIGKFRSRTAKRSSEVEQILRKDTKLKPLALLYISTMMRSVTSNPVSSSNIVETLMDNGYTVSSVNRKNRTDMDKLEKDTLIPTTRSDYTSYVVVHKDDKTVGAMGVVSGEINVNDNPVPSIVVQQQTLPVLKIAKMTAELVSFKKSTGIVMVDIKDDLMLTSGLGSVISYTKGKFILLKEALEGLYQFVGRGIPDDTLSGVRASREIESMLLQAYASNEELIKQGNDGGINVTRNFEIAITSIMVSTPTEINSFELKMKKKGTGFYHKIDLPSLKLPSIILNKQYMSGASIGQALHVKMTTTLHRGENYHANSESTRTLAAPFPVGKELFEACKLRTDLELYVLSKRNIRVLIEGYKNYNILQHFFNGLRMMGFDGGVYVTNDSRVQSIMSTSFDNAEEKYDKTKTIAKYGDSDFQVNLVHGIETLSMDETYGTVVFKYYDIGGNKRSEWLRQYNSARENMNLDWYGESYALGVFLTSEEIEKCSEEETLIASIAKHDLYGYLVHDAWYRDNHEKVQNEKSLIAKQKLPTIVTLDNGCEYYKESIIQNIIRTQYPFTASGFKDVYEALGMRCQVLNMRGTMYVKPKVARVSDMTLHEFKMDRIAMRGKEVKMESMRGVGSINNNNNSISSSTNNNNSVTGVNTVNQSGGTVSPVQVGPPNVVGPLVPITPFTITIPSPIASAAPLVAAPIAIRRRMLREEDDDDDS